MPAAEQVRDIPTVQPADPSAVIRRLQTDNALLSVQLNAVTDELQHAKEMASYNKLFHYLDISNNPDLVRHYTGLNADVFDILVSVLNSQPKKYFLGWQVECLSVEDQLLITLMKLKCNLTHVDLAVRFGVSKETVRNITTTYICFLHEYLFDGVMGKCGIPSQLKNQACLPQSFSTFSNCRIILDCTEVQVVVPRSSMAQQKQTFSHYKQRNTLKALIGVAPNGCITYVSPLYPGSASDKEIVKQSEILQHLVPGDMVLADKGFVIGDLMPPGVSVNVPPFHVRSQFTKEEVMLTTRIARARIHVERAIERVKNFKILAHIPAHYRPLARKIFQLCAVLVNMQTPIIEEIRELL